MDAGALLKSQKPQHAPAEQAASAATKNCPPLHAAMAKKMNAIAAVVVGGTSMSGGSGKLGGTLIGVLIIGILNNGLNLMGVNSDWQYIIKGAVILSAVYMDFLRNRKRAS